MGFAGPVMNSKWLIIGDAKSKFPIVVDMKNNTSAKYILTDNGPPFNSYEMNKFYDKYAIKHITTPPYHPASNGLAERFIRSFKERMLKEQHAGQTNKYFAIRNVLRCYRWTQHTSTGLSPVNMMLSYPVRTDFDIMKPDEPTKRQHKFKYSVGQLVWTLKHQLNNRT
ncbi:unnamed protein product [Rotaria magnacalcarata]|uniref:Integrase catalytic domain-containing protein n=1 Tax=Rotaria magnacalcarata TaxID=392030 RepID=A0A820MLE2_9BILA|nr:unnamed protein product [Rotaria magnacalcarata]CAF4377267.1 unnamed protein product [Rotaria magnacalcarata]